MTQMTLFSVSDAYDFIQEMIPKIKPTNDYRDPNGQIGVITRSPEGFMTYRLIPLVDGSWVVIDQNNNVTWPVTTYDIVRELFSGNRDTPYIAFVRSRQSPENIIWNELDLR